MSAPLANIPLCLRAQVQGVPWAKLSRDVTFWILYGRLSPKSPKRRPHCLHQHRLGVFEKDNAEFIPATSYCSTLYSLLRNSAICCSSVRITVCGCSVAVAAAAAASAIRDGAALLVPGWVSGLVHAGAVSPEGSSAPDRAVPVVEARHQH